MKHSTFFLLVGGLLLFSMTANAQEKKMMNEKMHKQMMEMMQDSTMMSMMMEHMAKDDRMRGMMMSKMMEASKADTSKMMSMCKMMMKDKQMRAMMMKMMEGGMKEKMAQSMEKPKQGSEHEQHHPKQGGAATAASNHVLVKFKPDAKEEQIKSMAAEVGMEQVKFMKELNLRVFKITSGKSVEEVIKHCQKEPFVEYAEPNLKYKTMK